MHRLSFALTACLCFGWAHQLSQHDIAFAQVEKGVADQGHGTHEPMALFKIRGDEIPLALGGKSGDADRGRALARDRTLGNCLICHNAPIPDEPYQGELGPDLAGVGSRLTLGQIRLRLVDPSQLDVATFMPSYYRTANLVRVADRFVGKPVLDAQQIEDLVSWLSTLKEPVLR
jgi:L-cysteine S-thiosulfotransferase